MAADTGSRRWPGGMIVFVVLVAASLASCATKKTSCADAQCKDRVSIALAQIPYYAPQDTHLSFPKGAEITIYGKFAGKDHNLWIGEFGGKRGYLPPNLVRETKLIKSKLLEIPDEGEDSEDAASNNMGTAVQKNKDVEVRAKEPNGSEPNSMLVPLQSSETDRNESVGAPLSKTTQAAAASEPAHESSSQSSKSSYVPNAQTLSELIKETWVSFKGTATMLSQPLESLQTFHNALSVHADRFSSTLLKNVMVKAEDVTDITYRVSDGTTLPKDYDYPASEVEYVKKSVDVASSLQPLPSNTVGHQSTPDIPNVDATVSKTVNVSPTNVQASDVINKDEITRSAMEEITKTAAAATTAEMAARDDADEEAANDKEEMSGNDETADMADKTTMTEPLTNEDMANSEWFGGETPTKSDGRKNDDATEDDYSTMDSLNATDEDDLDDELDDEEGDDEDTEDITVEEDDEEDTEVVDSKTEATEKVVSGLDVNDNEANRQRGGSSKSAESTEAPGAATEDSVVGQENSEKSVDDGTVRDDDKQREPDEEVVSMENVTAEVASEGHVVAKDESVKEEARSQVTGDEKEAVSSEEHEVSQTTKMKEAKKTTNDNDQNHESNASGFREASQTLKTEEAKKTVKNNDLNHESNASSFREASQTLKTEESKKTKKDNAQDHESNASDFGEALQTPKMEDAKETTKDDAQIQLPSSNERFHKEEREKVKKLNSSIVPERENEDTRKPESEHADAQATEDATPTLAASDSATEAGEDVRKPETEHKDAHAMRDASSPAAASDSATEASEDATKNLDAMPASSRISEESSKAAKAADEIVPTEAEESKRTDADPQADAMLKSTSSVTTDDVVIPTVGIPMPSEPYSGFIGGAQSLSFHNQDERSDKEARIFETEDVTPIAERHEESSEFADDVSSRPVEEDTATEEQSFFPDLQIMKSVKDFVNVLRPYIQLSVDMLPDFVKLYLDELEHQGVSPRVIVFTCITGFFNLTFLMGYLIVKRRSKEGRLIERLCKLDKQLFEAVTEKEVVKEELKNSKLKLSSLVGSSTDAQQTIDMLTEELTETKNETRKLEEAIDFLKEQLEKQTTLAGSVRESAEATLQKKQKLEEDYSELENELGSLKEENSKLTVNLEKSEQDRVQAVEELGYLQTQIDGLEKSNTQLLQEAQVWNQRVQELQEQSEAYQKSVEELRETLTLKEGELNVLQECILQMKLIQDENSDDSTETPSEKLEKLMDVIRVTAELKAVSMEKNALIERLNLEEGRSKEAEGELEKVKSELVQLKLTNGALQDERDAACTKLQVLSNYFKEKEIELQRELGVQEAKRQETQETTMTITQQIAMYEKDIAMYKSQVETLKKEIESQARSFKNQISQLESKAHDNWLATRAADRRSEEAKQEAAMLRNRLNLVEQEKQTEHTLGEGIVKPTPQRYAGSNGELPSPPQLDSKPANYHPSSGPSSLLREPLEPPLPPPHLPFLPQDRPLPPPPLSFPLPPPLPPPYAVRERMPLLPPPFDARGMPPFPPFDMVRRMPPPQLRMPLPPPPNRDHFSPSSRITSPYEASSSSPPPGGYRSTPPADRWNVSTTCPPFDRRPPSGRRTSPTHVPFDARPYPPPGMRNVRADRLPPVSQHEAHYPVANQREPFTSDNQKDPASDTQVSPQSASSGELDETSTAV